MANVTVKDTKQVIYDALVDAEKKLKELQAGKCDPVQQAKVAETKKAQESAKESVQKNIFSDELNQKYADVMTAIEAGESRIKDLYGIEAELIKLTTVVNAHKDTLAAMDAEKDTKEKEIEEYFESLRTRLSDEISAFKQTIADEKAALNKDLKAYKAQLIVDRDREEEEYAYNLSRSREKENDAWEDEKAGREAAIAEAEAKVDAAWDEVNAKAEYTAELETKVSEIPTLIAEAKTEGAKEAEKELGKDYGYKKSMMEKDHAYEISRLNDRLTTAEADRDKAYDKVQALEEKLDAAYAKIESLAGRTIEAAGGIKVVGGTTVSGK